MKLATKTLLFAVFVVFISYRNACEDSFAPFKFEGRKKFRSCKSIAKSKKTAEHCAKEGVSIMCPKTCGTCDEVGCTDAPLMFKIKQKANAIERKCEWVARKDTENRCLLPGVKDRCPNVCGTCEFCDDTNAFFTIEFPSMEFMRSCNWVAKQDTLNHCKLAGVRKHCKQTCGQC